VAVQIVSHNPALGTRGLPVIGIEDEDLLTARQWCELHEGLCDNVEPFRRLVVRRVGSKPTMLLACKKCVKALRDAQLTRPGKWAGLPCPEVVAPVLMNGERKPFEVELLPLQVIYLRALGIKVIPARPKRGENTG